MQANELESKYWREVLRRIIAVIVFLSKRELALRGHDKIIGSSHHGNFLGIIELLSKYDPVTKLIRKIKGLNIK